MTISGANSPEWFLADLGAVAADSVAVGVYPTNAGEAAVAVARDAETDVVVAEDAEQVRGGGIFYPWRSRQVLERRELFL